MKVKLLLATVVAALALASCTTPKDISYFQDVQSGSSINVSVPYQIKVQPGDKIRIIVSTQDERLSQMFNIQAPYGMQNTSVQNQIGYNVSSTGYIDFPMLGSIYVSGKTRHQIADEIKMQLQIRDLVKEPVVVVDYVNLGVSVLGDVKAPGRYDITTDRFTILEALSKAGDLNITAQRENVKVIREEVGRQTVHEVNLLDAAQLYASPVFFLQQNDVVYVEPNDKRKREATTNGNTVMQYNFWMSLVSLLTSVTLLIVKL